MAQAPQQSQTQAQSQAKNHERAVEEPRKAEGLRENESLTEKREREAAEAALRPKDFKLAQPGSRDYVAGQPVDDKELNETTAEAEKRIKTGHASKPQGGSVHARTIQQYGPEGQEDV